MSEADIQRELAALRNFCSEAVELGMQEAALKLSERIRTLEFHLDSAKSSA